LIEMEGVETVKRRGVVTHSSGKTSSPTSPPNPHRSFC
jgi:hypothetical protein